jgi:DedD protein
MAKPVSEEELQLKKRARRRLIGAIALVAGTAAVLPMVLDSEPKPTSKDINIQIPSPDVKGGFTSKVVPVPPRPDKDKAAPAAKPAAKAAESAPAAKAEVAPPPEPQKEVIAEKPPAPKPVEKAPVEKAPLEKVPAKAPEKAPEKTAALKPRPGTFYIQVIALAEVDKAKRVQQQIVDAGVRSYTEVVAAGEGKVTRVRAGPFATREEAERARVKLQGAGLEGKVAAN